MLFYRSPYQQTLNMLEDLFVFTWQNYTRKLLAEFDLAPTSRSYSWKCCRIFVIHLEGPISCWMISVHKCIRLNILSNNLFFNFGVEILIYPHTFYLFLSSYGLTWILIFYPTKLKKSFCASYPNLKNKFASEKLERLIKAYFIAQLKPCPNWTSKSTYRNIKNKNKINWKVLPSDQEPHGTNKMEKFW